MQIILAWTVIAIMQNEFDIWHFFLLIVLAKGYILQKISARLHNSFHII